MSNYDYAIFITFVTNSQFYPSSTMTKKAVTDPIVNQLFHASRVIGRPSNDRLYGKIT